MALSYNIVGRGTVGDMFVRIVDITLDNSYAAGGWQLTAQQLGFGANGTILAVMPFNDVTGRLLFWDRATNKLVCRDASGAANAATPEITTLTQMSGVVCRCVVYGKGQG